MTASALRLRLPDEAATIRLAQALADALPAAAVVYLRGDLGAGKSTLARALLRRLGVTGTIRSPTYTLVERYALDGGEALHLDLYRIGSGAELEFLGLDDAPAALWLVEWPERGEDGLPAPDLEVALAVAGSGRVAGLRGRSERGRAWVAALSDMAELPVLPEP